MKRSITRWTTALAAAATLAMPVAGWAQTGTSGTPQQPPATSQTTAQETQQNADSPDEHLRRAKAALNGIEPAAVTGRAKTKIAELKRHMHALERASGANDQASATGAAQRSTRATQPRGTNWGTEVTAISKILNELIGPQQTGMTGDPAAATGTTGTSGTTASGTRQSAGKASATVTVDDATREKLNEVRTHITAYAAAKSGTQATQSDPASSSPTSSTTGTTGSASATGSVTGATGAATGTTGSTAGTTGSMTGTTGTPQTTGTAAQPTAQVDDEAARRHLTEARDILSQLTQLPAAAQLTGDARTQVSQLITNFNTLITAQSNWRESFDKVEANLNALIGAETTDEPSATTTSTTTSTATGTTGAVGTSGTASGAVNLDATIRAKLVELRQKLNAFEQAAGGGASAPAQASMTAGTATTGTATTGTSATGTTSATSGTTGTSGTMTSGTEQQSTQQPGQKTEQMGHNEALRHIEAIEAILKVTPAAGTSATGTSATGTSTTGTSGTSATAAANLTLDRAQLDQLKMHLSELRKLINQAERK